MQHQTHVKIYCDCGRLKTVRQEHLGRYEYENIRIIISWLNWSEIITDGVIKLSLNLSNQSIVFVHMQ